MTRLAIFALATSVMQTISFSHHAATMLKLVCGGSAHPCRHKATDQIHLAVESIVDLIAKAAQPTTKEEANLLISATECSTIVRNLVEELDKPTNISSILQLNKKDREVDCAGHKDMVEKR